MSQAGRCEPWNDPRAGAGIGYGIRVSVAYATLAQQDAIIRGEWRCSRADREVSEVLVER